MTSLYRFDSYETLLFSIISSEDSLIRLFEKSFSVMELRRVAKTSDKIRLVGLGAHTYSPCAHIDSIIDYTPHMNIDPVTIVP